MVQLSISVPLANILLWTFTEAFIVLMSFHGTRLLARYLLNHRLSRGHQVSLTSAPSLVDALPYNSDLEPLPRRAKLVLTAVRFAAVAISVYVGAALDGAVAPNHRTFAATLATGIATKDVGNLTRNDGNHIPAMAKLSCLRIMDNNNVALYRGYVAEGDILCEDGSMTYTKETLVHAQIRPDPSYGSSMDLSGLNLIDVEAKGGLSVTDKAVTYNSTDEQGNRKESVRIQLISREGDLCTFGVQRSKGSGFDLDLYITLTMTCEVKILEFKRMLAPKPSWMPPRMSFLYQTLDALVLSERVTTAPTRKGGNVQATITLGGLATAIASAAIITVTSIVLWLALQQGGVKKDFTSVKGLAEMWADEKFGGVSQDGVFVVLPKEGGSPYLGSMDGEKASRKKGDMNLSDIEDETRGSDSSTSNSEFEDTFDTQDSGSSAMR